MTTYGTSGTGTGVGAMYNRAGPEANPADTGRALAMRSLIWSSHTVRAMLTLARAGQSGYVIRGLIKKITQTT